ncbi:MAG: hypothetical protein IJ859_08980 [Synergistaceae bacterium]|nr:hypothetical protein [Synergistaceae bacterium]
METEYVYKNAYDIEVHRLEERMDSTLSRIESRMDAYLARMDARDARMEGRLDTMEAKLGNMNWALNMLLAVAGIAVAGVSIYLAIIH